MESLNFGKYNGFSMYEIPQEYLEWGAEKLSNPKWQNAFIEEKQRRNFNIESAIRNKIKLEKIYDEAYKRHLRFLKFEAANSGCEWEYDNYDFDGEAKALAYEELKEIQIMIDVNEIRQDFMTKNIGFNLDVFNAIEHQYFDNGKLYSNMFSCNENYLQAVEYMKKVVKVRGHYYHL